MAAATRRESGRLAIWGLAALAVSAAGIIVMLVVVVRSRDVAAVTGEFDVWPTAVATIVPFAIAGAVLIDRRPDLPFGWILAAGAVAQAVSVAVAFPSLLAVLDGNDGALPRWGLTATSLWVVPIALQGVINVRFPTGRPASARGRALEIAIVTGTALAVLGGVLGATSLREIPSESSRLDGLEHPSLAEPRSGVWQTVSWCWCRWSSCWG
ncbi:MAG: hypothetical protein WBM50_06540 [Acidimicrobiales bacterium]